MQKQKKKNSEKPDKEWLAKRSSKKDLADNISFIKNLYRKGRLKFPTRDILLILNKNRQIVFANDNFFNLLGNPKEKHIYGLRPGEAIKCLNSSKTKGGCGTSDACMECGAFLSILSALQGHEMEAECRIIHKETNKALDFAVHTFPLEKKGEVFAVMSFKDISNIKRREVLERIFLHDLLNIAGGLQGLSSVLTKLPENERSKVIVMIQQASTELVEEIQGLRQLLYAEMGNLRPFIAETTTTEVINKQLMLYTNHSITKKRRLFLCPEAVDTPIRTDASLLGRVIGNMIKNALEASKQNGTVSISCKVDKNQVEFSVHNETFIPESDQLKIFQRSFSTKGKGRGIGTYCIKLLTENYLQGKVRFDSSEDKGTTFYVQIPRAIAD
ncbi:MAG: sensor histidine kinase [Waddliaceae bacterium]